VKFDIAAGGRRRVSILPLPVEEAQAAE
jgi:hypothetical protein